MTPDAAWGQGFFNQGGSADPNRQFVEYVHYRCHRYTAHQPALPMLAALHQLAQRLAQQTAGGQHTEAKKTQQEMENLQAKIEGITRSAMNHPIADAVKGETDVVWWKPPEGNIKMIAHIEFPCPWCAYPNLQRGSEAVEYAEDDRLLSINAIIKCQAHWPKTANGQVVTGSDGKPTRSRCGFIGVLRQNHIHHPACTAANQRVPHEPQYCTCGGLPTQDEIDALQRDFVNTMGTVGN